MDKKNNNKLKQYKKKLTTKGRVDMSKGGRVSLRHGGNHIKGAENQEPTKMKFGNPKPKSTKPAKPARPNKPVRDLSDPTGQTFLDPKDVPNMKVGNQEPRNNTPAPPVENRAVPTTFQQAPIES